MNNFFDTKKKKYTNLCYVGRFDREIGVDLPDIKGRFSIFKVHLKKISIGSDRDDIGRKLSALTPGYPFVCRFFLLVCFF